MNDVRYLIQIQGTVQGVGFRPFVWTIARKFGFTGFVFNSTSGVTIEVQGSESNIESFLSTLTEKKPPHARIDQFVKNSIPLLSNEFSFQILQSQQSSSSLATISPDLATCPECLKELYCLENRRYAYPFINCTHCGPRFTIQTAVPYDRQSTTMSQFALCEDCKQEFESPEDRRFHAQPNACHRCGPKIWFVRQTHGWDHAGQTDEQATPQAASHEAGSAKSTMEAIEQVRTAIAGGEVVAIKGIGGFHLACDAKNSSAVSLLRTRKRRPFKPLAVMVSDIETAKSIVEIDDLASQQLQSPERPIVLLQKLEKELLAEEISPSNPYLGVVLPYAPIHYLLMRHGDLWVMTSGNLADEPIVYDNAEALQRLKGLVDGILFHDRPIYAVCDDSVARISHDRVIPIRRSRGYTPLPIKLKEPGATMLAVGGEIKNAICLAKGEHAFLGQHLGDMGNRETLVAMEKSCQHLMDLYQADPNYVIADQHPGYISVAWASRLAQQKSIPLIQVQHHHAHAASLLAEHGFPSQHELIACVFDGTGFGNDGAIWGGEILLANMTGFRRLAHIEYAPLPGGDSCILTPAKTALAYLQHCDLPWENSMSCVNFFSQGELTQLRTQLERRLNTVSTSSMGRLFDAVAAIIGVRNHIDYEGQAALELESLANDGLNSTADYSIYPFHWSDEPISKFQLKPILHRIVEDVACGAQPKLIAAKFHLTIAKATAEICSRFRNSIQASVANESQPTVGLTGGVFQNSLLVHLLERELLHRDFRVLTHQTIPPNDGGIALGQIAVARAQLAKNRL
ncbi:MAG: carbamoyltransferase HypF [Pirellulales bacterium]